MEQNVKKIAWYSLLTLIMVVIIGVSVYTKSDKSDNQQLSGVAGPVEIDVVGTRVGTTTTAVAFSNNAATTTYITKFGNEVDNVIYNIYNKTLAAGGGASASFTIAASSDPSCDTASTTTVFADTILQRDIHWYDALDNLRNRVHTTTLATATSSINWTSPIAGTGREIILEDLNARCLALSVSASGTSLYIQAITKQFR